MGKIITSGGLTYRGALTAVNGGVAQANLIHSYTGSGVLRYVNPGTVTVSIEIDGVHKYTYNSTIGPNVVNVQFTTGFKIYASTAVGTQVAWVYQTGASRYSQVVGGAGTASAGTRALQTSVSGSGRIAYAVIQAQGGKLVVDGVTLIDNQTNVPFYLADIYYNTSFDFYGVTQAIVYT